MKQGDARDAVFALPQRAPPCYRLRPMPASPILARRAAVDILVAVLEDARPLDQALAAAEPALSGLERRDRGFTRALVATALRRLGRIDRALETFLARPLPAQAREARAILRLGAAQLLFMGTPAYAAVDAMTGLAGALPAARSFKGLVNAVLRRVAGEGAAAIADLGPLEDWPGWLARAWSEAYGRGTALAIAEASAREAPLDLTAKADPAVWAERLGGRLLPTGSIRLEHASDPTELAGYEEGAWWVQDAAAALPARLLGPVAGRRVLDLCAAPGGKTLQLAARGARVTALDAAPARVARLKENLDRTGLPAAIIAADAREFAPKEPFDAVLLDAPCTATGTLRRRPDVAWAKSARQAAAMSALQAELIMAAARQLAPGGRLVFATCSLLAEEGEGALAAARAAGAPLALDPVAAEELPGLAEALAADGSVRTLPSHWPDWGGMDGFFIARLRRV